MNESRHSLPCKRIAQIAALMGVFYYLGYGLQVAGWHMVDRNGGNTAPHPRFFSQGLVTALATAAMHTSVCAASVFRQRAVSE